MIKGVGRFPNTQHGFCIIALCHGMIDDKDFYAFVAIEPKNYLYFQSSYRHGRNASFSAYGTELLRGWGCGPPNEVTRHVCDKHNIELNIESDFIDRLVSAAQNTGINDIDLMNYDFIKYRVDLISPAETYGSFLK